MSARRRVTGLGIGIGIAGALAMATPAVPVRAQAAPQPDPAGVSQHLPAVPLTIRTRHGVRRFSVEVARTPEQQELGLMFRRRMPADHGMIFPTMPPRRATFWMKNTVLPLDIVFIRADGSIIRVAEAKPFSLDIVDSYEDAGAVLELNAGTAKRLGIAAGDRVGWTR